MYGGLIFFFFSSRRRHTRFDCDWSSDVCSPDGKLHLEKGMFRWLVVRGPAPPADSDPAGDVTITLNDYGFEIAPPLTAGAHTLRVVNAGPQLHELMLLALAPGKGAADVVAWEPRGAGARAP